MNITILPEDAKNQRGYMAVNDCLLATAIKRQHPEFKLVLVGDCHLTINKKSYFIKGYNKIYKSYHRFRGDETCIVTKPFDVELIPI